MAKSSPPKKRNNQAVGNAGLYYVSYLLSCAGWNVLPTSRNARGIDAVIYSETASRKPTIQIKTLSKSNPVPLGGNLDHLYADYVVICVLYADKPQCYVMSCEQVRQSAHRGSAERSRSNKVSYWLQPKDYRNHQDNSLGTIGSGWD